LIVGVIDKAATTAQALLPRQYPALPQNTLYGAIGIRPGRTKSVSLSTILAYGPGHFQNTSAHAQTDDLLEK
jgi:hypothetical protein